MPSLVVVQPFLYVLDSVPPPSTRTHVPVYSYDGTRSEQYVEVLSSEPLKVRFHDPMVAELRARLPFDQEHRADAIPSESSIPITLETLRMRFWNKTELRTWVEENCRDDVLMQSVQGGLWRFCCVDYADREPLYEFLSQRRKYTFDVNFANMEELAVIEQWVEDNVRGEKVSWLSSPSDNIYNISIRNKQEAVLFRLRFSALA